MSTTTIFTLLLLTHVVFSINLPTERLKPPPPPPTTKTTTTTRLPNDNQEQILQDITKRISSESREIKACMDIFYKHCIRVSETDSDESHVDHVMRLCDEIDSTLLEQQQQQQQQQQQPNEDLITKKLNLRMQTLKYARYDILVKMMKSNYESYVKTASFLSPNRIPRLDLPNVQDVPYDPPPIPTRSSTITTEDNLPLVEDCQLENLTYQDSILDKILLYFFRNLVTTHTGGITSPLPGITGLLEQGRTYMLQPNQTSEAQHLMVRSTLKGLMTPVLPPFYRIFMSGIIPKTDWKFMKGMSGKQLGPWFYAPFLTSFVTPTFFRFLVGPSYVNRRKDGELGGLVVEKCRFLQESGCKGLCLNQCKLPAQQFFKDELGLELTVSPNFVTQECQWSFGEKPLPPEQDPSFPRGCLVGCESRKAMAGTYADKI